MDRNNGLNESANWSEKTILVADDDNASCTLIEGILELTCVKIIYAGNGLQAVNVCKTESIDLILMDLRMPVMDGYKAAKLIGELSPNIPIIAITACVFATDKIQCEKAGFKDFISKPIEINVLMEKIACYLCLSPVAWY